MQCLNSKVSKVRGAVAACGRTRGYFHTRYAKEDWKYAHIGTYLGIDIKILTEELSKLPCLRCGKFPIVGEEKDTTGTAHDACLSNLPGVRAACCGHGVAKSYIIFKDGRRLQGDFELMSGV